MVLVLSFRKPVPGSPRCGGLNLPGPVTASSVGVTASAYGTLASSPKSLAPGPGAMATTQQQRPQSSARLTYAAGGAAQVQQQVGVPAPQVAFPMSVVVSWREAVRT